MSNLILPDVTDYPSAVKFLGTADHKRLAHNTTIYRTSGGVGVSYHSTMIIEYMAPLSDESGACIRLNSNGYSTRTTSDRMHRLTPSWMGVRISRGVIQVSTDWMHTWRDLIDRLVYVETK